MCYYRPHTIKLKIGLEITLFSWLEHFNGIALAEILLQCTSFTSRNLYYYVTTIMKWDIQNKYYCEALYIIYIVWWFDKFQKELLLSVNQGLVLRFSWGGAYQVIVELRYSLEVTADWETSMLNLACGYTHVTTLDLFSGIFYGTDYTFLL